jgi:hypothetical protein
MAPERRNHTVKAVAGGMMNPGKLCMNLIYQIELMCLLFFCTLIGSSGIGIAFMPAD